MTEERPHPFTLVFAKLAPTRFAAIKAELGGETSVDAFLLCRAAVELLGELRPDEGIGDAIDDFIAFVHAAYHFWAAGANTVTFDEVATRILCRGTDDALPSAPALGDPADVRRVTDAAHAMYIQVAPRLVWGQLALADHFEPLDGWFDLGTRDPMRLVACFGVHPTRPGLSVLPIVGTRPTTLVRDDGSTGFAPTMPGGDAAGLFAVTGGEELLLMAGRAIDALEET